VTQPLPPPTATTTLRGEARKRIAFVLTGLVLIGIVLQAAATPLAKLGLVPVPQRYIALDFPNPTALPTLATAGAALRFRFQLTNPMPRPIAQPWQVVLVGADGHTMIIATGTAHACPRCTETIAVAPVMPSTIEATTVEVKAPSVGVGPLLFHIRETYKHHSRQ
jgi:hypothetical protein